MIIDLLYFPACFKVIICILLFIYPFLTITSIIIDQSFDLLIVFSSGTLFYLCDHSSLLCFMVFNSIIYFSFIFLLSYFIVIIILYSLLSSLLIIPYSIIGSNTSFYIPIYQDGLLILSSYFFKAIINLIEVIIGFDCNYSLYHVHFISSIQLISFIFSTLFLYAFKVT